MYSSTLLRASARQAGAALQRRAYATQPETPPGGNRTRSYIVAALVAIPAIYLLTSSQSSAANTHAGPVTIKESDPAQRAREKKEDPGEGQQIIAHLEDREPEKYKVPFGQRHPPKRVDSPPEGRNHQALSDRNRVKSGSDSESE